MYEIHELRKHTILFLTFWCSFIYTKLFFIFQVNYKKMNLSTILLFSFFLFSLLLLVFLNFIPLFLQPWFFILLFNSFYQILFVQYTVIIRHHIKEKFISE